MSVSILTWISFLIVLLAGNLLGRLARGLWRSKREPHLDKFVLDTSMGLGLLSLVIYAMAAAHCIRSAWALAFVLPVVLAVATEFGLLAAAWLKQRRWPSVATAAWVVLFICLAFVVLIPAAAPPSGSDWDSLAYHLSIPKLYLQHGGFYYIDFASHSNFPFLVEMLYTPALALNEPSGAKMVHYLFGVLLVLAVVMLVRKHFDAKAAPLAALGVVSMPLVLWEATTAYIDLATALYTVLAVYLLLDYLDKAELRALVGCGIAAGFAASTKMTGLALIPMLVAWLVIDRVVAALRRRQAGTETGHYADQAGTETGHYGREASAQAGTETGHYEEGEASAQAGTETGHYETHRARCVVGRVLAFVGVALLVCSPWYIKTFIYTGSPVYPFFYSIFGGKDWTAELAQTYTSLQGKFGVGHDLASFLMLPWDLTFHSERFYDTPGLFVGPILLVAAPLLMLAKYRSRKLLGLTLFFLSQMVIWFGLTQQSRYLLPAFAILAVIVAAVAYSDERFRITRIALYAVFAAMGVFGVLTLLPAVESAAPVVFGSETRDAYLARTLPIYPAEKWINENTPAKARIALFGDTRGFYLDRDYVWADPGHNKRFTRGFASPDGFVGYLKSQGITYAMVNYRFFARRDGATGTAEMVYGAIDQGVFEQVYPAGDESSSTAVYRIR